MALRNAYGVSNMCSLKHLLIVLAVIVKLHVNLSTATACGFLPTDGNANAPEVLDDEREDEDEVTFKCLDGYEVNDASGDTTYERSCDTDTWDPDIDTTYCTDTDECDDDPCGTGYCVNVPGTYVCVCDAVALHDDNDCDGYQCGCPPVDPNAARSEAGLDPDDEVNYTCFSGFGVGGSSSDTEYTLDCEGTSASWDSIDTYCQDIDECTTKGMCGSGYDSSCRNTYGSYICVCDYPGAASTSTGQCEVQACGSVPIYPYARLLENSFENDEVLDYVCAEGYETEDGDPGYSLICQGGDWVSESGNAPCYNVNECREDTDICGEAGECHDVPGSYICVCPYSEIWNSETNTCEDAKCKPLPPMPNAQLTSGVPTDPVYKDEIFYTCEKGHHVLQQTPCTSLLPIYNGYSQTSSFSVTCSEKGQWEPFPIPVCIPVYCGDPGIIMYATRSEGDFTYGKSVDYTCLDGFRPKDTDLGASWFPRTCQEDGSWSKGTECVDIDECTENQDICGSGVNYCLNTKGSYICSCVPWYIKNPEDTSCVDWAGLASFPIYKPCEIVKSLRLCINGDCALDDGQAICRCNQGWTGIGCDVKIIGTALIVAITALICVTLLLLVTCFYCIYHATHRHRHPRPPVYCPPQPPYPNPPPPPTMRLPKAPPRYPKWGSDRDDGGNERGLRRTPDKHFGGFPFH